MGDLRLWSHELITDFIELYKSHQCLWDVKCDGYKSKYTKSIAYKDLVQFCKKRGFPEANRDFVTRKLQSLRGSFRKEVRKIEKYRRQGQTYKSNLWYFSNLLFTKDESAADNEIDDHRSDDDEADDDDDDDDEDEVDESKFSLDGTEESKPSLTYSTSPSPAKKLKKAEVCFQPEFLDIGQTSRLKHFGQDPKTNSQTETVAKDLTEFELTGMNVAKKLARMDPTQAIYAESIINNVIKRGLLKKLREETDICDNVCGKNRVNLPTQSFDN